MMIMTQNRAFNTRVFSTALLVEDEPHLATSLEVALRKMEIQTRVAGTVAEAKVFLSESLPEFILLDRMLPDGDGLSICSWLREKDYHGAILVLTASGQTEERVRGLNSGADDYLAKPFSWEELEARIKALARRHAAVSALASPSAPALSSSKGPAPAPSPSLWTIDENRLRIFGKSGWIELTPLEFKLASKLITNPGINVSRDELLSQVWGFRFLPKTRTVDHFLGRLRKYFEPDCENPRHFLTIRGAGYRFEP